MRAVRCLGQQLLGDEEEEKEVQEVNAVLSDCSHPPQNACSPWQIATQDRVQGKQRTCVQV